jgi:hypothetical protein
MADAYTPTDGLKNVTSFPTDPADETAARKQVQDMLDQMLAFHNTHLAENAIDAHAAMPAARVYNGAAQSITTATPTALAFNSERFDTDTIHDVVTNNSRLTCKTAGIYSIFGSVRFATNAIGRRELFIKLNGTTIIATQIIQAVTDVNITGLNISTLYSLSVNNYVELFVQQTSGGDLNVDTISAYSPEFAMVKVG